MQKNNKFIIIALILSALLIMSLTLNVESFRENRKINRINSDSSYGNTDKNKKEMIANAIGKTLENMIKDHLEYVEDVSIKINMNDKISLVSVIITDYEEQNIDEKDVESINKILLNSIENLKEDNIVMCDKNGKKLK